MSGNLGCSFFFLWGGGGWVRRTQKERDRKFTVILTVVISCSFAAVILRVATVSSNEGPWRGMTLKTDLSFSFRHILVNPEEILPMCIGKMHKPSLGSTTGPGKP